MPGRSPAAEDLHHLELAPERALLAAMLRCAVADARGTGQSRLLVQRRASAQAWLRDERAVRAWLELLGLPEATYSALLKAAGLEEKETGEGNALG